MKADPHKTLSEGHTIIVLNKAESERAVADNQELRQRMVMMQLAERGIQDTRVLKAMGCVRRERFVAPEYEHLAYEDCALPIAEGQTISQPYMVAIMSEALGLRGGERVLEIGTGSGYQAAVLAKLTGTVISMERQPRLAEGAARLLRELQIDNVEVVIGDGSRGLASRGPYEAIVVTAGAPAVPTELAAQLSDGGRLVIPVGSSKEQMLLRLTRQGDRIKREELLPCVFVPLIGALGWQGVE